MKSILKELTGASAIPFVLCFLANGDTYGYEIIKRVKHHTDGQVVWQEASVYPLLKKLKKNNLIKSYWKISNSGRPRKYYSITDDGKKQLEFNIQELKKINRIFELYLHNSEGI